MDVEDFKKKYEQLKDNPMYKNFCSILDTKSQVLERTAKENQDLKKKLDELQTLYNNMFKCHCNRVQVETLLSQQKEFIEYLEDKLNMCDGFLDTIKSDLEEISYAGRVSGKTYIATQIMKNETAMKCYEEVLSKYKEITGVDN